MQKSNQGGRYQSNGFNELDFFWGIFWKKRIFESTFIVYWAFLIICDKLSRPLHERRVEGDPIQSCGEEGKKRINSIAGLLINGYK